MENKMNLSHGLRIKFLKELIEQLKNRIQEHDTSHIHTTIMVLEDMLYVMNGDGLNDK